MEKTTTIDSAVLSSEQLCLFSEESVELDSRRWSGSFNARESSMHQLAPYVGKMKSGMVHVLVESYSKPGDVVLDPFCGAGVVPLESVIMGRHAVANDLSPYAYVITNGKLSAPSTKQEAMSKAEDVLKEIDLRLPTTNTENIPEWVQQFFHPSTLREIVTTFQVLEERQEYFLMACLLGILHHVRPGFLSYPASHLTPYLRVNKYPPETYPDMYAYRDLRSRLLAKVTRSYRRTGFTQLRNRMNWQVLRENTVNLSVPSNSIDAIISSPPYFGALDYARDNRLRLWFLGVSNWKELDRSLTANDQVYIPQMKQCLRQMYRVLKDHAYCVLVLGDVERNGKKRLTAQIVSDLAYEVSEGKLIQKLIYVDEIPDIRRSRRQTCTTKIERILVMQKTG
jgi:hypothetical protein